MEVTIVFLEREINVEINREILQMKMVISKSNALKHALIRRRTGVRFSTRARFFLMYVFISRFSTRISNQRRVKFYV